MADVFLALLQFFMREINSGIYFKSVLYFCKVQLYKFKQTLVKKEKKKEKKKPSEFQRTGSKPF